MDKRPSLVSNCDYYSCFAWFLDCVFGLVTNTMEIKSYYEKLQVLVRDIFPSKGREKQIIIIFMYFFFFFLESNQLQVIGR